MMSAYDVIIIGTGAGGGTLAHRLAPVGQADPAARARRLAAARAAELVAPHDVFVDNRYISPDTWYDARRQAVPAAGPLLRRRRDQALRRRAVPAARARTSASCATTTASRPRGRSPTTRWSRTTPQAEQLYQVHGARGEDPTEPPASAPYPFPAVVARAAHPAALRRPRGGRATTRSTRRAASCSTRRTCRTAPACAARPATASRASCTPSPTPRCSASGRRSSTRTSRCSPTPRRVRLETNAAGTAVTGVVVEHDGEHGDATRRHRRRLLRRGQHAPSCCSRRPTTRTRDGLANGSDQVGRNYMFHNSQAVLALSKEPNPTVFQKTLGLNDFYFARPRLRLPAGQHPDGRQVAGARCTAARSRCETKLAPHVDARRTSPATRSTSGCRPRTCRGPTTGSRSTRDGNIQLALHAEQRRCPSSGCYHQLQVDARPPRHAPRPPASRATPT